MSCLARRCSAFWLCMILSLRPLSGSIQLSRIKLASLALLWNCHFTPPPALLGSWTRSPLEKHCSLMNLCWVKKKESYLQFWKKEEPHSRVCTCSGSYRRRFKSGCAPVTASNLAVRLFFLKHLPLSLSLPLSFSSSSWLPFFPYQKLLFSGKWKARLKQCRFRY